MPNILKAVRLRHQLHLFCLVTTFWTLFFLGGLWSDYYQTWPWLLTLIVIDIFPAAVMIGLAPHLIRQANPHAPGKAGWIVAFYFSVPFLIYDFVYLFLYLRQGPAYLLDYWYLTFFSLIPWVNFPLTGRMMAGKAEVP